MTVGSKEKLKAFVESSFFIRSVVALILLNAVILGLETEPSVQAVAGTLLSYADSAILVAFSVEIALRLYVYGWSFFRSGWNLFDLAVVAVSWVPATEGLSVLRALRVIRVLRLISVLPQLRRVIGAIAHSIPGMASVIGVLCLVFYISSVLTTKLFGSHPDPRLQEWFGSIGSSAYTLFQVMTLESWSMGIVRPTMEIFPWAWLFFVPFIIVTSFAILNLFIGIIVDSMQAAHAEEDDAKELSAVERATESFRAELATIHARFDRLEAAVGSSNGGTSNSSAESSSSLREQAHSRAT